MTSLARPELDDRSRLRAPLPVVSADVPRVDLLVVPVAGPVPDRDGHRARRRTCRTRRRSAACRTSCSWRPGCWPRRRCSRRRSRRPSRSWPAWSGVAIFHGMYATPISPRDIALGNLAWIAARLTLIATIFTIVIVAVRRRRIAAHRPGHPRRGPDRDGLRRADRRVQRDAEDAGPSSRRSSASGSRRCSCSRGRSSRSARCRRRCRRSPG